MAKLTGTLENGFEFEIDEELFNDWEILEYISDIEDEKATSMVKFMKKFLGDAQYKALKRHIKKTNGERITYDTAGNIVLELFQKIDELKN